MAQPIQIPKLDPDYGYDSKLYREQYQTGNFGYMFNPNHLDKYSCNTVKQSIKSIDKALKIRV